MSEAQGGWAVRLMGNAILTLALVVPAMLFAAGYAARYVHPDHMWWLQLVALGLPYLAVLVVGIGVGAALLGRWGMAGLYVPLVVLAGLRFFPFQLGGKAVPEPDSEVLTVMTYNAGSSGEGHTSQSFRALMDGEKPDVLALQEVSVRFMQNPRALVVPSGLGSVLSGDTYTSLPPADAGDAQTVAQPVFVRSSDDLQIRQVDLVLPGTEGDGSERNTVRAEIQWGGRHVAVYNLHLHSFDQQRPWRMDQEQATGWRGRVRTWRDALRAYRTDFVERAEEAARVRRLLDEEALPYIVCGDFNSTRHQWAYWHVAAGLREALVEAGVGSRATFPARRPLVGIDHILASPSWRVVRASVPASARSDHRPVVATLYLAE